MTTDLSKFQEVLEAIEKARAKAFLAVSDDDVTMITDDQDACEALRQSILKKAFAGELGSQESSRGSVDCEPAPRICRGSSASGAGHSPAGDSRTVRTDT